MSEWRPAPRSAGGRSAHRTFAPHSGKAFTPLLLIGIRAPIPATVARAFSQAPRARTLRQCKSSPVQAGGAGVVSREANAANP
eukprot:scaffold24505_cov27-Tisochrysis_lutea.AAC.4